MKMQIVEDSIYSSMYRVKWPDGVLSADMYNKSWANNHSEIIEENDRRSEYRG